MTKSNLLTDECCILENISQNSTFSPEKLDNTALEELKKFLKRLMVTILYKNYFISES